MLPTVIWIFPGFCDGTGLLLSFPSQLQDLGLSELSESITTHSLFSGLQYFVAMLLLSSFLSCVSSHNIFTVILEEFGGN